MRNNASLQLAGRLTTIARHVAGAAAAAAAAAAARERNAHESAHARPTGPEAEAAGAQALRDLTASPADIAVVRGRLQPEHFARAGHGELYAVMQDMAEAGKPIDPVTVTWEASRRGIQADAADLADGTAAFATASSREVLRHGYLAQLASAAHEIERSATGPAASSEAFLSDAAGQLGRQDSRPRSHHHQPTGRAAPVSECPVPNAARQAHDHEPAREAVT